MRAWTVLWLALLVATPAASACDCTWAEPELVLHPPDCLPACDLESLEIPATLRMTWTADVTNPFPEPHYDPDAEWQVDLKVSTGVDEEIVTVAPSQTTIQASQDGIETVAVAPEPTDPHVFMVTEKSLDLRLDHLQQVLPEDGLLRAYLRVHATPDSTGTPVTQDPYTVIAITVLELTHKDGVTAWGHVPLSEAATPDEAPSRAVPGFAAPVFLAALGLALMGRRSLGL